MKKYAKQLFSVMLLIAMLICCVQPLTVKAKNLNITIIPENESKTAIYAGIDIGTSVSFYAKPSFGYDVDVNDLKWTSSDEDVLSVVKTYVKNDLAYVTVEAIAEGSATLNVSLADESVTADLYTSVCSKYDNTYTGMTNADTFKYHSAVNDSDYLSEAVKKDSEISIDGTCGDFYRIYTNSASSNNINTDSEFILKSDLDVDVDKVDVDESTLSIAVGDSKKVSAVSEPSFAQDTDIFWASSDTSVATVNANGDIKGVSIGSAEITAYSYSNVQAIDTVSVQVKSQIDHFAVYAIPDKVYTSEAITPDVTIKDGQKMLALDVDYTLKYSNNINVGKATITIIGKGDYEGTNTTSFNIIKCPINDPQIAVSGVPSQIHYNEGKNIVFSGAEVFYPMTEKKLQLEKDYTMTYSNNSDIGKATITITGKGNYSGTQTVNFFIIPSDDDSNNLYIKPITAKSYTGREIEPIVRVFDDTEILSSDCYTVEYYENINVGQARVFVRLKGDYTGVLYSTFDIKANVTNLAVNSVKISSAQISWEPSPSTKEIEILLDNSLVYKIPSSDVSKVKNYNFTNLTGGKKYNVTVRSYSTLKGYTATKSTVINTPIDSIKKLSAVGNFQNNSIKLSWEYDTKVSSIQYFIVLRKKSSETLYLERDAITVSGTTTSFTHTEDNLEPGVKYDYKISAFASNNVSSNEATCKGIIEIPAITITSAKAEKNSIRLQWKALNNSKIGGYYVYRSNNKEFTNGVKIFDTDTTSFEDTSIAKYTMYYYKICAYSTSGIIGTFSVTNEVYIEPSPMTLTVTKQGTDDITVSWKPNSTVSGYYIYRQNTYGTKKIDISKNTTSSYTDHVGYAGTSCKYWITPYVKNNGTTMVAKSYTVVQTVTRPRVTTIQSIDGKKSQRIIVKWSKVSSATGYVVQSTNDSSFKTGVNEQLIWGNTTISGEYFANAGKKAYVRIRCFKTYGNSTNGTKVYGSWCTAKNTTVTSSVLNLSTSISIIGVGNSFTITSNQTLSSASSSNTSIATVSVSGKKITVTPKKLGAFTITAKMSNGTYQKKSFKAVYYGFSLQNSPLLSKTDEKSSTVTTCGKGSKINVYGTSGTYLYACANGKFGYIRNDKIVHYTLAVNRDYFMGKYKEGGYSLGGIWLTSDSVWDTTNHNWKSQYKQQLVKNYTNTPVFYNIVNRTIYIHAFIKLTGYYDSKFSYKKDKDSTLIKYDITYGELIKKGIRDFWTRSEFTGNSYDFAPGVKLKAVVVFHYNPLATNQEYTTIYVGPDCPLCKLNYYHTHAFNNFKKSDSTYYSIWCHHLYADDNKRLICMPRNSDDPYLNHYGYHNKSYYALTAAHEFGHALGLEDAYYTDAFNTTKETAENNKTNCNIMCNSSAVTHAMPNDIEMILRACQLYHTNKNAPNTQAYNKYSHTTNRHKYNYTKSDVIRY